jgi:hypothetical protein
MANSFLVFVKRIIKNVEPTTGQSSEIQVYDADVRSYFFLLNCSAFFRATVACYVLCCFQQCMSEGSASNFLDQDLVPDLESSLLSLISEMHFAIPVLCVLHVLMPSGAVPRNLTIRS